MSERLSNNDLEILALPCDHGDHCGLLDCEDLRALAAELRSLRISDEERAALVRLKLLVHEVLHERRPTTAATPSQRAAWDRLNADLRVLDRLTGGES